MRLPFEDALLPKEQGKHRWGWVSAYRLTANQAQAAADGAHVKLEEEMFVYYTVACFDCGGEFHKRRGMPCPVEAET